MQINYVIRFAVVARNAKIRAKLSLRDLRLRKLIKKLRAADNLIRRYVSRRSRGGDIHRSGGEVREGENHESAPLSAVLSVTLRSRTVPRERKSSNYRPAPISRIFRIARAKERVHGLPNGRGEGKEPQGCSIISIGRSQRGEGSAAF